MVIAAGSSTMRSGSSVLAPGEYQGRVTVSLPETKRHRARALGTRRAAMASEAKNSRMLERNTARPSPPRQYGVAPPPLSWNSQCCPSASSTSSTEMARPSP